MNGFLTVLPCPEGNLDELLGIPAAPSISAALLAKGPIPVSMAGPLGLPDRLVPAPPRSFATIEEIAENSEEKEDCGEPDDLEAEAIPIRCVDDPIDARLLPSLGV